MTKAIRGRSINYRSVSAPTGGPQSCFGSDELPCSRNDRGLPREPCPGNGGAGAGGINAARPNTGRMVAGYGNLPAAKIEYEGCLTSHRETRSFLSYIEAFESLSRSLVIPQNNGTAQ